MSPHDRAIEAIKNELIVLNAENLAMQLVVASLLKRVGRNTALREQILQAFDEAANHAEFPTRKMPRNSEYDVADYAARGRKFAGLSDAELSEAWVLAFRNAASEQEPDKSSSPGGFISKSPVASDVSIADTRFATTSNAHRGPDRISGQSFLARQH